MVGSYRIEQLAGMGGMGRVYRGWDEKLRRPVAVKVLRNFLSTNEVARRRFVREAQLASRVVHPFVATVFDVVEEADDIYLVMEYVEGRPLSKEIKRRTLSPSEVTAYGREIADGLAAIHQAGLIHRDLKPSNVMLTKDNHAKVMDLGLVRQYVSDGLDHSTESTLTRDGFAVGTPYYMSPEQISGLPLDHRSDLFSLGVILYEALTGKHPFSRDSFAQITDAIVNEDPGGSMEPRSLSESGEVRQVILRLLERHPSRRFESAEQVAVSLGPFTEVAGDQGAGFLPRRWPRALTPVLLTVAAMAIGLGIYWISHDRGPDTTPPPEARPLVAVLPVEDHTREGAPGFRGEMLAALLTANLSESRVVRSMGHERLIEILSALPRGASRSAQIDALLLAMRVDWIVAASVFPQGDAYEAVVDVIRPGGDGAHDSFRVGAARAAGLVNLASARLEQFIDPDLRPDDSDDVSAADLSSESDEALLLAYEGRRAKVEYRFDEAIELFERALEIDPQFLSAQLNLAKTLKAAGYGERARNAADRGLRMVEGPVQVSSMRQALEARALHARFYNEFDTEIELRRELARRYPDEPETLFDFAVSLMRASQYDEGLSAIERSLALEDKDPWHHALKGRALASLGNLDAAFPSFDRAEGLFREMKIEGGVARTLEERGHAERVRRDLDAAARAYEESAEKFSSLGLEVTAARARGNYADTVLMRGELATARTIYESVLPVFRRAENYEQLVHALSGLGTGYYMRSDFSQAESLLREAVGVAEELKNPSLLIGPLTNLTSLTIYTGRLSEGRRLADRALAVARQADDRQSETALLTLLATTSYQRGKLDEAEQSYRDLIRLTEAPGGDTYMLASSWIGFANVLDGLGKLEEALGATDSAVELASGIGDSVTLGYALCSRAYVRSNLSDAGGAEEDLTAAGETATATGEPMPSLAAWIRVVRGGLAMLEENWTSALREADAARKTGLEIGEPDVASEAMVLRANILLNRGDAAAAIAAAREGLETAGITAVLRTRGQVVLAEAHRESGDYETAAEEARRALDAAESMGDLRMTAMAASVLVSLPDAYRPVDVDSIRKRGREALEGYIESAPDASRDAVRSRKDLERAIDLLGVERPRTVG